MSFEIRQTSVTFLPLFMKLRVGGAIQARVCTRLQQNCQSFSARQKQISEKNSLFFTSIEASARSDAEN